MAAIFTCLPPSIESLANWGRPSKAASQRTRGHWVPAPGYHDQHLADDGYGDVRQRGGRADESGSAATFSFHQQAIQNRRLKSILTKNTPNPVCGFVDNSLAKNRQRTGPLAVDKSQRAATYPPRDPLPTSSTDHLGFNMQFESQNQALRLIPLLELTRKAQGRGNRTLASLCERDPFYSRC